MAAAILFPLSHLTSQVPATESSADLENYWMLIEPAFLRPKLTLSIEGGRETFFVPGKETPDYPGLEPYSLPEFKKLHISKESFYSKASRAAGRRLDKITPKIVRDTSGKPLYAVIHLECPLASGLLIADNFPEKFFHLFGHRMIAMVPDRYNLFVFPENKEIYSQYLLPMAARFEDATFACSREIFLWENQTKKPVIIGSFGG